MSIEEDFESALGRVKQLASAPSQDKQLELYGLYKQSKNGDVSGKRPGMLDMVGRAKYDAWSARKGMSSEQAMTAYIALVDELSG